MTALEHTFVQHYWFVYKKPTSTLIHVVWS